MVEDLYFWIGLRQTCGIGNVLCKQLIERFCSPQHIFEADRRELTSVPGITEKTVAALHGFKPSAAIEREIERAISRNISIIPYTHAAYPRNLRHIHDPPAYIYVKGDIAAGDDRSLAVVGSRNPSEYGRRVTRDITRDIAAQRVTIVSGMARGIDTKAHQSALSAGGRTIAVLGSGIDVIYPPENRKIYEAAAQAGAVISEYPPETEPNSYHFPARNRIISGIARGVLVTEASLKSGSLITARLALEQGRDVFAIPGSAYSYKARGPHALIKNGAKLVESAGDILEELQWETSTDNPAAESALPVSDEAQAVYRLLTAEPVQIDNLIAQSARSSASVSALLLELELGGHIRQLPGKRFVRR